MIDDQYSRAVVAYVGNVGHLEDRTPEERVVEALGDTALEIVPRINAMLDDLYSTEPPLWNAPDIAEVGRQAESWLRSRHPRAVRGCD